MTTLAPADAVTELRALYRAGHAFGAAADDLLDVARGAPEDLAEAVVDILEDVVDNRSTEWRLALLERAERLAPALARAEDGHDYLVSATWQLISIGLGSFEQPELEHQGAAARRALGWWGRWPDDASDEILDDIEDDPTDTRALDAYAIFLQWVGLTPDAVAREIDDVAHGRAVAGRARLDELAGARATTHLS